jgi:DNA-binding Lrp family transcriptional regulator
MMTCDATDKKLIGLLQRDFPLSPEPFNDLGCCLGLSGAAVLERTKRFKEDGLVRQIGPVLEARKLGHYTTLIALKIASENVEKATEVIKHHRSISHGYLRQHEFNVWVTLTAPSESAMKDELHRLKEQTLADEIAELPVVKLFKIGFYLDLEENGRQPDFNTAMDYRPVNITPEKRAVLNELQQDLPLIARPFDAMARNAGIDTEGFLSCCRSLKDDGVMRRFGAAVNHRRAGYVANAMTCWAVPPELVDAVGTRLAAQKEVSHCYERKAGSGWAYNLFAMIHGRRDVECFRVADAVTDELGLDKYSALFSIHEIKKERVKHRI